ncbi:hypothetical protein, partial [Paenibacillus whitsoniae]|uniref:hypothetical protein n=1 Tax=Paenibacillus whitsoniae TaxID=2496558 RepID=UPI0013DF360B
LAGILTALSAAAGCSSGGAASTPITQQSPGKESTSSVSPSSAPGATPSVSPGSGSTPSTTVKPVAASPAPPKGSTPPASAVPTSTSPAASPSSPASSLGPAASPSFSAPEEAKSLIASRANETIAAIQNKDFAKLATLIHPQKGVQFSPYSYLQPSTDVIVPASGLAALWTNPSPTHWGMYDGSGDSIDLTFPNYWAKFVYNANFAAAPQISYNTLLGKGNMTNNVFSIYPTSSYITVEYHFPGIDPQFQGMDWTSLRLVFVYTAGEWYLVAIVHDQHTM